MNQIPPHREHRDVFDSVREAAGKSDPKGPVMVLREQANICNPASPTAL